MLLSRKFCIAFDRLALSLALFLASSAMAKEGGYTASVDRAESSGETYSSRRDPREKP